MGTQENPFAGGNGKEGVKSALDGRVRWKQSFVRILLIHEKARPHAVSPVVQGVIRTIEAFLFPLIELSMMNRFTSRGGKRMSTSTWSQEQETGYLHPSSVIHAGSSTSVVERRKVIAGLISLT